MTAQTGGFILAGGESSRMGQSKALLQLNGAPMILHVANLVASITGSAIVIGPPHAYDPFGLHTIADDFPGAGPLGGIATALRAADKPWNLIVACDMPYLTQPWLHHLIARALASPAADALIPMSEGGAEPLCAMYHKRCEAPVRAALARGTRKVTDGLSAVRVQTIAPADWKAFDSNGLLFKNMNSPEDYEEAKVRLEKGARARNRMSDHYLEFRDVSIAFEDHAVLKNVSFFVNQGETAVILGRSGVGKSVSLKLLLGFLQPDAGRIIVAGQDVTDWSEEQFSHIRRRVTMVFQSGALFDSLTIAENVAFPLEGRDGHSREAIDKRVNELLEMLEVAQFADRLPSDLSTGMKRAVAIARALAEDPDAILYDEPTTMVDPLMASHVGELILKLKKKFQKTSVVVTHDTHLAKKLADRVIFLVEGRVAFFGTWPELEASKDPFLHNFLKQDELIPALDATA